MSETWAEMKDRMQRKIFEGESDSNILSPRDLTDLTDRLNRIADLCRKHNNPASNVGAHALAGKVLKIVEGEA